MKPDYNRAKQYENDANKSDMAKINEKVGIYNHIIQTYVSLLNYSILRDIVDNLDLQHDTKATIWNNEPNKHYIEVQFYPVR